MSQVPVLEVRDLVKRYPTVHAVSGVSFAIPEGVCFGLLGPNGAGKTTTIEMMEGITAPTSGDILYRGSPAGLEFKKRSGIQFQETALQDFLTGREVLRLFSALYPRTVGIEELSRLCDLEEYLDRDVHKLSGGQRQRLLLAVALVNDPEVLFLDEPTTGLDPQARRNFWELVRSVKARGKTIILTTHYMEEAYELCDEIAIMDRGKIIARGVPDALLQQYFGSTAIEIPLEDLPFPRESIPWQNFEKDGWIEIQTREVNATLLFLIERKTLLERMKVRSANLEDLFLALTGKELRQ